MGVNYSQLVFPTISEPVYSENLEGFCWIPNTETRGQIPAVWLEYKAGSNENPVTILYSHENNENICSCLPWLKRLRDALKVEYISVVLHL